MAAPAAGLLLGGALAGLVQHGLRIEAPSRPVTASGARPVTTQLDDGRHQRWGEIVHPTLVAAAATSSVHRAAVVAAPLLVRTVLSDPVWTPVVVHPAVSDVVLASTGVGTPAPVVAPPAAPPPPVTGPPVPPPPVTDPPVTDPPVTPPPVTDPPVTPPPVTDPPVTDPPIVPSPPVTDPPVVTDPPATDPGTATDPATVPLAQPPATDPTVTDSTTGTTVDPTAPTTDGGVVATV
jgi:hypothetical protein